MNRTEGGTTEQEIEFNKQVGRILRGFRKASKSTQKDVAEMLGVTYQQVQKYENGKSSVSLYKACKFCKGLNVGAHFLIKGVSKNV